MKSVRASAVALLAAAFCACGGSPTGPTPPTTGGGDCPPDQTFFYCSDLGYACSKDGDCCGSLTCDPATRACTDGVGGLHSGFRCSQDSLCLTEVDGSKKEQIAPGVWAPVYCQTGICRWVDPRGQSVYCSKAGQACSGNADCCGSLWCDQAAGQCTDGRTPVSAGYRCSDQTQCVDSQSVGGRSLNVYCDTDGICKWPPYCAQ